MNRKFAVWAAGLALALIATGASAHHSFSMFDATKTDTLTGTVRAFDMINPHSWLQLIVVDASGKQAEWSLEMGDPDQLRREGWSPTIVKPGDTVTVRLHPLLDQSHGGQLVTIDLPGGQSLDADTPAKPPFTLSKSP